ncbi:MAG: glycosyltransferase [Prochloraceae cyanobacterium]|nr:glycosyltransferase [Prochloraceae cyanobacterium]
MRIAFIVGRFPVISETFILNQIAGLIDRGNDLDIYAVQGKPIEQTDKVHPIVEKYQLLDRTHYPAKNAESYLDSIVETHASMFEGKEPYDIIHCQFGPFGVMAMELRQARIIQGKIVTGFRGFDISRHLKKYGADIYQELFKEGDLFLANCEFFRQRAIRLGCNRDKIEVHGSGIDCDKFSFTPRYLPDDGIVRVATVGRFVEKKGIEYAIQAIAKVVQKHPQLEYHLIGDGHLREQFENLIKELEIEPFVVLHGWKEQREIVKILDRCQLFVAPSVTAPDGNQDAPVNTLKEAMAMGLPAIGTLHGGIPELVEDGISGFLVPEKDPQAIAEKLSELIQHPENWPQMGRSGRDRVKTKYDMNMLNNELYQLYQKLACSEQLIG